MWGSVVVGGGVCGEVGWGYVYTWNSVVGIYPNCSVCMVQCVLLATPDIKFHSIQLYLAAQFVYGTVCVTIYSPQHTSDL